MRLRPWGNWDGGNGFQIRVAVALGCDANDAAVSGSSILPHHTVRDPSNRVWSVLFHHFEVAIFAFADFVRHRPLNWCALGNPPAFDLDCKTSLFQIRYWKCEGGQESSAFWQYLATLFNALFTNS